MNKITINGEHLKFMSYVDMNHDMLARLTDLEREKVLRTMLLSFPPSSLVPTYCNL